MRKLFLTILCAGGLCLIVQAQDSTVAREHIKYLSSKELHGRGVAYNGEHNAAKYIIQQLTEHGVEPLGKDFIQKYDQAAFAMEGDVIGKVGGKPLIAGEDFRIMPFSMSLNDKYNLIRISPGDLINHKKIAAINKKYADVMSHSLIYLDNTKVKFKKKKDEEKYKEALGLIKFFFPFKTAGFIEGVDKMPAWGLSETHYKRQLAYIYMKADKISDNDRNVEFYYTNELTKYTHFNVCGMIPGTEHPEQCASHHAGGA